MTQLGEAIAIAVPHSDENPDCPFCPMEEPKEYTTYDGNANKSVILEDNMNKPDSFPNGGESGARPKDSPSQNDKDTLKKPEPIGVHPDQAIGAYSCQAHHLISGKQALAHNSDHDFEKWIKASHGTIAGDTGYSVNNFDNGIWMPSVPENTKKESVSWGKLDREVVANEIMEQTGRQFHCGGHSIPEIRINSNGKRVRVPANEAVHEKYDEWLIERLRIMSDRMSGWANVCPFCFEGDIKKEKVQPSVRLNKSLDLLGDMAQQRITGPRKVWSLFISSLAFIYHDEVCEHGANEDEESL
jgi:hypothetical protein